MYSTVSLFAGRNPPSPEASDQSHHEIVVGTVETCHRKQQYVTTP